MRNDAGSTRSGLPKGIKIAFFSVFLLLAVAVVASQARSHQVQMDAPMTELSSAGQTLVVSRVSKLGSRLLHAVWR